MRQLTCLIFLAALCSGLAAYGQTSASSSLGWLTGSWQTDVSKRGKVFRETWVADGDALAGTGVTLTNGDTTLVELIRLAEIDGVISYVATVPENKRPVVFRCGAVSGTGFTCENPDHDFPKKIEYVLNGEVMTATISAGDKAIVYRFRKIF